MRRATEGTGKGGLWPRSGRRKQIGIDPTEPLPGRSSPGRGFFVPGGSEKAPKPAQVAGAYDPQKMPQKKLEQKEHQGRHQQTGEAGKGREEGGEERGESRGAQSLSLIHI